MSNLNLKGIFRHNERRNKNYSNDNIDKEKSYLNCSLKNPKRRIRKLSEYKEITNFDETKKRLQNMKLELPNVPNIADININRLSKKRDEKILEEIIKPKDDLINELHQDKLILQQELLRKSKMFKKAEKYQKERDKIITDNKNSHNEVEQIKSDVQII